MTTTTKRPDGGELFAWLIEAGWTPTSEPEYWCGVEGSSDGMCHHWSQDPFMAIRFAREKDAKSIAKSLVDGDDEKPTAWRVCEHGFATPTNESPAPQPPVEGLREALKEAIDVFEGMNDDEINEELLPRLKAALFDFTPAHLPTGREHDLKTWPEFFEEVIAGRKTFEVRHNDRDYKVGDILWLREWSVTTGEYSGRETRRLVTYVMSGRYGVEKDTIIMALASPSLTAGRNVEFNVMDTIDPDYADSFERPSGPAGGERLLREFVAAFKSGAQGCDMDCDTAQVLAEAIETLLSAPAPVGEPVAWPASLHPRTLDLVKRFSLALAEKLRLAEEKYGFSDGWTEDHWEDECRAHLYDHLRKGDPRDVAAYCAFMWHHGWITHQRSIDAQTEPVAFRFEKYFGEDRCVIFQESAEFKNKEHWTVSPLYTAPPVTASAEEIARLLEEARDLLMERIYGSWARSPSHNARLKIEEAIALLSRPQPAREDVARKVPRVTDNDHGEIIVTMSGKEIRGWSYSSDQERRSKMLCAREFVEGFCEGRES